MEFLPIRADQDALVALFASLYCVVLGKNIPVMPLVFGQHSGTLAERTHTPQGIDDCRTNKFRPVRNVLDGSEQFVINFKGNDAVFFVHLLFASNRGAPSLPLGHLNIDYYKVIYYYHVIPRSQEENSAPKRGQGFFLED